MRWDLLSYRYGMNTMHSGNVFDDWMGQKLFTMGDLAGFGTLTPTSTRRIRIILICYKFIIVIILLIVINHQLNVVTWICSDRGTTFARCTRRSTVTIRTPSNGTTRWARSSDIVAICELWSFLLRSKKVRADRVKHAIRISIRTFVSIINMLHNSNTYHIY